MENVNHILIIHQGAIGDFILSLPAISSFKDSYPDASVEIWGYLHILRLVEKRFYADTISSIDQKEMAPFYSEDGALDAELIEHFKQFDCIVIFGKEGSKTLLHNLKRVGVKRVCFVDTFPHNNGEVHIVDHQLSQLSRLGYAAPDTVPKLFPDEEDAKQAAEFFNKKRLHDNSLKIAIHIGSGSRMKAWPTGRFVQLSKKLIEMNGAKIILPVGPADEEMAQEYVGLMNSETIIPIANLTLNELAAILKKCDVYVGNDSGVTHVAAAVGVPVVALYGPTNPQVWGVRGDNVSIMHKEGFACFPCSREEMRGCVNQRCLEAISVEEVYEKVTNKLDTKGFGD